MTKEEKEAVLHCLRAMIDEELCEECPLYGTTGTDHCEKDCVRLAIGELEQELNIGRCKDCKNFRELPYHTETLGRCINHSEFYPKGDWFCADFEPREKEV